MGPILVPIEGKEKIVIECDVRPMSEYCARFVFWCPTSEFVISKNKQRKVPYLRICTSTKKHITEERRTIRALEVEVKQNAKRLAVEEANQAYLRYQHIFRTFSVLAKWLTILLVLMAAAASTIDFWMPILLRMMHNMYDTCILGYYTMLWPHIVPIKVAIELGDNWALKHFLYLGADVNCASPHHTMPLDPPLVRAALLNNTIAVKQLLEHPDIDVNVKDAHDKISPLVAAIINENMPMLGLFMKYSELKQSEVLVNMRGKYGRTALFYAAHLGRTEAVKALLSCNKTQVNTYDEQSGTTPLMGAILYGHNEIVKMLLRHHKIDVNGGTQSNLATVNPPLMVASFLNNTIAVQHLLEHSQVNVNIRAYGGESPLTAAAICGNLKMLRLFLQHPKIEINTQDHHGRTALFHAAQRGHSEVVSELLGESQTLVNTFDTETKTTPLMISIINGYNDILMMLLQHRNIDINARTSMFIIHLGNNYELQSTMWASTLTVAAHFGNSEAVKMILQDPRLRLNDGGLLPLTAAAQMGHVDIVRHLLAHPDVDPNAVANPCRETALTIASRMGHHEVVSELLKHERTLVNLKLNREIDMKPKWIDNMIVIYEAWANYSPLSAASGRGHVKVVKTLLDSSDIKVSNDEGLAALEEAADHGHSGVVRLLLRKLHIYVKGKT